MSNLQDFSLIGARVKKIMHDNELKKTSDAFYHLAISSVLDLDDEEISDSITDTSYLKSQKKLGGHDRGIDAISIEKLDDKSIVHIFNCKYTDKFEKSKTSNFPSSEIEKISEYLRIFTNKDKETLEDSNFILQEKTREIWNLSDNTKLEFRIHLCSNYFLGLIEDELKRMNAIIKGYFHICILQYTLDDYAKRVTKEDVKRANAKFRVSNKELFEKSDGNIRALIVNIKATEIIRIILDNDELRESYDLVDNSIISKHEILEDIFYDNVRVYKKGKNKINKSIKDTAKYDDRIKFFYFNNGITITCSSFYYLKIAHPVITIEEFQVVNGSQTLHALFDVSKDNYKNLEDIELLCRIYELKDPKDSSKIAEYTNSQNPVTTRDIRSIDYVQQKLETEFKCEGYFYERKKNQYENETSKKRINAEKAGQAMLAFYNEMPNEAKNKKSIVFGDKYDEIFNDEITSQKVLLAYQVYLEIELRKKETKKSINVDKLLYEEESFILYATYYFLYILNSIVNKELNSERIKNIELSIVLKYYDCAKELILRSISKEKSEHGEKYTNADFFKSSRLKAILDSDLSQLGDKAITKELISKLK